MAARSSGIGSGMFNSPNTAAMMGTVPGQPPRHRRRRADDAAEHRRGALDRLRAGDRHRRRAQGRAVQDLLRRGLGPQPTRSSSPFIHNMHTALWVLAATSLRRRRRVADAARHVVSATAEAAAADLRIGEVAKRVGHDAAHDPLLRGDRAARRRRAAASRGRHRALRRARRRAPARRAAPARSCSASPRRAQGAARGRGGARRAARGVAPRRPGPGAPARDPRRVAAATSTASSSSCAAAATRSPRWSASSRPSAASRRGGCASWATSRAHHRLRAHAGTVARPPGAVQTPPPWRRPERQQRRPSTSGSRRRAPARLRGRRGART